MSFMAQIAEIESMTCWPLGGFAPGGYFCKCQTCSKGFHGDKRSWACLECAVTEANAALAASRKETEGLKNEVLEQPERIAAAAIFHGACISLPPPARHHTILNFMATTMDIDTSMIHPVNQGFLTSKGRFVNRTEGYYIAERRGQIIEKSGNKGEPTLFSEDMW